MANEALMELSGRVASLETDLAAARAEALAMKQKADKAAQDATWARGKLETLQGPELDVKLPIITITRPQDSGDGGGGSGGELTLWVNFNAGPTKVAFPGARVVS